MFKLHQLHPSGTYVSSSYLTTPYIIIMLELDSKNLRFEDFHFPFGLVLVLCLEVALQKFKINLLIDFLSTVLCTHLEGLLFLISKGQG